MSCSSRMIRRAALTAIVAAGAVPFTLSQHAAASGRPARTSAPCAALGTYQIGAPVIPNAMSAPGKPTTPPTPTHVMVVVPFQPLAGSLTISSYSACGQPTSGTFTARRTLLEPPGFERPNRAAIVCAMHCWPAPGIVSIAGSFVQDPLHPGDPTYVSVSATMTTTRTGPPLGRACSTTQPCSMGVPITSTVAITGITGYLQVGAASSAAQPSGPTVGTQSATLSFLPPPAAGTTEIPSVVVLSGWRGHHFYKPPVAP